MTRSEIEVENALKKLRYERNQELKFEDGINLLMCLLLRSQPLNLLFIIPREITYLRFVSFNAMSIGSAVKWNQFLHFITDLNFPHIIMVSETWFNFNSLRYIKDYSLYSKDRTETIGGGVAIYTRNNIKSFLVSDEILNSTISEQIWCSIRVGKEKILLVCIYHPLLAQYACSKSIFRAIEFSRRLIHIEKFTGILISGDFNHEDIIWDD